MGVGISAALGLSVGLLNGGIPLFRTVSPGDCGVADPADGYFADPVYRVWPG